MMKKRIVVGLSGGVDSAVVVKLLVEEGHEVIGVFMKNWDDSSDEYCPAAIDAIDARNVAAKVGIPFYTVNFSKEYWDDVFEYFLEQHRKFRTPNPDILCNKFIKFKVFLDYAKKFEADYLATGHYAKNIYNEKTKLFDLRCAKDQNKDQTYFLYTLGQEQLKHILFPLAGYTKPEIRKMAKSFGFENAEKKDSTGICFVGERDYMQFLKKYLCQMPGNIVTELGEILGTHIGLSFYTIGQRKKLNIGGVKGFEENPWFVLEKNIEKNELVACQDADNPKLFQLELEAEKLHWVAGKIPAESFNCRAKVRYRQTSQVCSIRKISSDKVRVKFKVPQRAITPGQSIVFYDEKNKICFGGGEIS
ncbi:tRNA 2-thiouridine(34) synthase MnmA [Candidatus Gracilibacteria bacterium]|nr:tRNA 2-thiouridine(34) synthase MnmA [Candidatus Gracilibacteria bacterium]